MALVAIDELGLTQADREKLLLVCAAVVGVGVAVGVDVGVEVGVAVGVGVEVGPVGSWIRIKVRSCMSREVEVSPRHITSTSWAAPGLTLPLMNTAISALSTDSSCINCRSELALCTLLM